MQRSKSREDEALDRMAEIVGGQLEKLPKERQDEFFAKADRIIAAAERAQREPASKVRRVRPAAEDRISAAKS